MSKGSGVRGTALRGALAVVGLVWAALAPGAGAQAGGGSEQAPLAPPLAPLLPPPEVPAALRVPEDQALLFRAYAQGTQVYGCRAGAGGGFAWTLLQPVATLVDDEGLLLGIHGRGPFWAAYDGSRVVGAGLANVPAPAPARDIPLLLLRATGSGEGRFAPVTYIQRLDTRGGVAPPGPCDPTGESTLAVPYLAVYYFYGPRAGAS
ncbi:MAG TPA: DUF3455 domain-containing protein [Chloroflexota bacterium]|nr:DUF3455 domain-containing protein [Chloroflexota bacterium]